MREKSFSDRRREGWSMVELMDYYALTEREYDRIISSLEDIHARTGTKTT